MEDSYMTAVRTETQQKMRSYSFELKYLIAGHTKAYQGKTTCWICFYYSSNPSTDNVLAYEANINNIF